MTAVILICASHLTTAQCDEKTARAVVVTRIESIICGVGAISASYRLNVGTDEFVRVICRMR